MWDGLLALVGVGTLAGWTVAVFFPDQLPFRTHGGTEPPVSMTAQPTVSAPAPASAPTSPPAATISLEPAAVTLQVTDLPPGYRVLKAGPAMLSAGADEASPAGWDVVFAPEAGRPTAYLLVESAVAVYRDAESAVAAVEAVNAAEQAAHAVRQAPVPELVGQQAVWIEPAFDRPGYGIVRVTWQSLNVVGQVGVLGALGPSEPHQTAQLAMVEHYRIWQATVSRTP